MNTLHRDQCTCGPPAPPSHKPALHRTWVRRSAGLIAISGVFTPALAPVWLRPTVVASAVVNQELAEWNFGARARYASGFPRPSVVDADYDLQELATTPVLSVEH